jgi:hypothetical protein
MYVKIFLIIILIGINSILRADNSVVDSVFNSLRNNQGNTEKLVEDLFNNISGPSEYETLQTAVLNSLLKPENQKIALSKISELYFFLNFKTLRLTRSLNDETQSRMAQSVLFDFQLKIVIDNALEFKKLKENAQRKRAFELANVVQFLNEYDKNNFLEICDSLIAKRIQNGKFICSAIKLKPLKDEETIL